MFILNDYPVKALKQWQENFPLNNNKNNSLNSNNYLVLNKNDRFFFSVPNEKNSFYKIKKYISF